MVGEWRRGDKGEMGYGSPSPKESRGVKGNAKHTKERGVVTVVIVVAVVPIPSSSPKKQTVKRHGRLPVYVLSHGAR